MSTAVRRVAFTKEVEQAIEDGTALAEVLKSVKAMRKEAILRLRTALEEPDRQQLLNLQTLLREQQDTAAGLVAAGDAAAAFWEGETRFYSMPDGSVHARCAGAEVLVGHHFPASQMLVVTDLTREARRMYFKAMATGKVLLHAGPAGTGKTETCKDTAMMLGRNAVVLNCNGAPSPCSASFAEAVAHARASGQQTPVILDEVSRLPAADIDRILQTAKESGTFLCMTWNPGYAGRPEPPQSAISEGIQVEFTVPGFARILSVMLGGEGFVECDCLGERLQMFLEAVAGTCSKQRHYDFGLRFMKSAVRMAGSLGRAEGFSDERAVLARVARDTLWMQSTPADREALESLVAEHFGSLPPLPEELRDGAGWPRTSAMVGLTCRARHCVMIVNVAPQDEAACEAALQKEVEKAGAELMRVPGTMAEMTQAELYGEHRDGAWTDGAFSRALRHAVGRGKAVWLAVVCGSGEDLSEKFNSLNTLMDDNKVLCLASGERLPLAPHTRIIFLAQDATHLSPATISRAGQVYAATARSDLDLATKCRPSGELPELDKTVKVDFGEDVRRLQLRATTPAAWMAELQRAVARTYGVGPDRALTFLYRDDEGDLCTLVEATLPDALALSAGSALRIAVGAA